MFRFTLQGRVIDRVDRARHIVGVCVLDVDEGGALFVEFLVAGDACVLLFPVLEVLVGEGSWGRLLRRFVLPHDRVNEAVHGAFHHLLSVGGVFFRPVVREGVLVRPRVDLRQFRDHRHEGLPLEFLLLEGAGGRAQHQVLRLVQIDSKVRLVQSSCHMLLQGHVIGARKGGPQLVFRLDQLRLATCGHPHITWRNDATRHGQL